MSQLDGIDVFVRVVQCGSFSAAARVMGMPVTTVSGKVASLEKRLGVTLLNRTTRKLSITEAGDAYFKHCVRALEEVSAAENAILTSRTEPEGLLRLTAPPDIGHIVLPPIVRRYLKTYPKTQVELILTNRIVDLVGEGVDLAIRAGKLKDSSLVTKKFRDTQGCFWASSAYARRRGLPRRPKELSEHDVIVFKGLTDSFRMTNGREWIPVKTRPRIIVDDLEAAKVFVLAGEGIGMFVPMICEPEEASGKLVRVLSGWTVDSGLGRGHLSFVYPPQRFVAPKVQAFIRMAGIEV